MKAYGKNIRISPKKMLVIAEAVKGKNASDALKFLKFAPKKWAKLLYKLLYSAVKNAENNESQNLDNLQIATVIVSKGIVYKRGNPISRGRMHPILKRTSNIKLELELK